MKRLLLTALFFCTVLSIFSKPVGVEVAKSVATNFYYERVQEFNSYKLSEIQPNLLYTYKKDLEGEVHNIYYLFNFTGIENSFIIISADDDAYPVLGYSFEIAYSFEEMPDAFQDLMAYYVKQIETIIDKNLEADDNIKNEWNRYLANKISRSHYRAVSPLVSTTWDQNKYYNKSCPADSKGPDGYVYAGCVATAMGQVMKYHGYPSQGTGSKSYYHSTYGTLSANFGMSSYNWSSMPNSVTSYNTDVADLLYHCGVSVEMNYTPYGSGAYVSDVADALKQYFGYASTTTYKSKSSFTDSGWDNLLKSELDSSRPIIYRGQGSSGGHAWVLDGYQGSSNNHYHMNWGWSGYQNGYFYLTNLNPGIDLTSYQAAVVGINPSSPVSNYDLELYDDITVSPDPVIKNGSISVWLDIANYGNASFSGDYLVALFDATGSYVTDIEELSSYSLDSMSHYKTGLTFSKSSLSVATGTYLIAAFYKESGGNWQLLDEGSYSNPVSITVSATSNPSSLALYDSIQVSPNPIQEGKAFDVYVDFANYDQTNAFYGDFACYLLKTSGEVLALIDSFQNMSLAAYSHYKYGITFSTSGLNVSPGEYLISIQHKPSGGNWQITNEDIYNNPITIKIVSPPLDPDVYEVNNTEENAYELPLSFTGDKATIKTTGSNIHIDTDADYYKIVLPAGIKYTISARVHDSRNSGDGNDYSGDVIFSYKTDDWSTTFNDIEASDFDLINGGTLYFKVEPYFYDEGTYLLDIEINRSFSDLYVYNENITPLTVEAGNTIDVSSVVKNQGNAEAVSTILKYYISDDKNLNSWDVELGSSNVGSLAISAEQTITETILIPSNTSVGNWYLIFAADADDQLSESDETNNLGYKQFSVTASSSIQEEVEEQKFLVYPNPASTTLNILFDPQENTTATIRLIDLNGKILIEDHKTNASQHQMDINKIASGVYLLNVILGNDHFYSKIIIE